MAAASATEQRRGLFVTVGLTFLAALIIGLLAPILPVFARDLGASGLWIGLIFSGSDMVRMFLGPWVGQLYDRTGKPRLLLQLAFGFHLLAASLFWFTRAYVELLWGRIAQGLASGFFNPVAGSVMAQAAPAHRLSSYLGLYASVFFLGFGLAPVLGGWIADHWGIRAVFPVVGTLALVGLALATALPTRMGPGTQSRNPRTPLRETLRNRVIQSLLVYRLGYAMARSTLFSFFPILAVNTGLSKTQVGWILSVQILLLSLLQFPAGWLVDRTRRKGYILHFTLWTTGFLLLLMPTLRGFWEFLVLGLFLSLAGALSAPAALGIAAREGQRTGTLATAISVNQSSFALGMIVGPVVSGWVFDTLGLATVFWAGALYVVLDSLFLVLWFRRPPEAA